jgi:hypothetical protein
MSGAPPDFGIGGGNDPNMPPATQPFGSHIENNFIYV